MQGERTSITMEDFTSEVSYSQPWSHGTTGHDAFAIYDAVVTIEIFSAVQSISYRVH